MNSNNQCLRLTMLDFAIGAWLLTYNRKACNPNLSETAYISYKEGIEYLRDTRKLLYEKRMYQELLYIDQIEGLYLEMLRNYCLESFLSTIILSRILSEYLLDSIYNISLPNNSETDVSTTNIKTKITCIRIIYGNKVKAFLRYLNRVREKANDYLHQAEKQGKMIPRRAEVENMYRDIISKFLGNAPKKEIDTLIKQLAPCTASKEDAKEILELINKLLREFKRLIKIAVEKS